MENMRAATATSGSVDAYMIYSKGTIVTMSNVEISGYSGQDAQTGGGAMRIRAADYSVLGHTQATPSLENVAVDDCCRGIRIQDCTGVYVYNCTTSGVTDNAFYLASGTYASSTGATAGCKDCTFDTCTATDSGNTGFMLIGMRDGCVVKDSTVNTTRGAGAYVYNIGNPSGEATTVIIEGTTFVNVNTSETVTPHGGNTDDAAGAAIGFAVGAADTGSATVRNCTFTSSGNNDSVFFKSSAAGTLDVSTGNTYAGNSFGGGVVDATSSTVTGSDSVVNSDGGTASGDPYFVPMLA
ncbi:MAG: hypothetical protein CL902_00595 [Dehalococcoidia bacterium]|nr:hypothetical protein [Dehalococcoidia bacterium]